jgi:catechol 2,3-dioxygenase-like lactoylglutathione lyase family enzyme
MIPRITQIALLVREYDEAIIWFGRALGFVVLEDSDLGGGKRWVRVAPTADAAFNLLLARATNERQLAAVGNQHGGRVGFFLHTDDFCRSLRGRSHPAATSLPSIDWINRQACIEPAMRTFRLIH